MHIDIPIKFIPPPHSFTSIFFKPIQLLDTSILKTPWLVSLGAQRLASLGGGEFSHSLMANIGLLSLFPQFHLHFLLDLS